MSVKFTKSSGGRASTSTTTVLGIIFITLKLLEIQPVAAWSWWMVLSPIWVPMAIVILALLAIFLFYGILFLFSD